jgi:hypothetical protein
MSCLTVVVPTLNEADKRSGFGRTVGRPAPRHQRGDLVRRRLHRSRDVAATAALTVRVLHREVPEGRPAGRGGRRARGGGLAVDRSHGRGSAAPAGSGAGPFSPGPSSGAATRWWLVATSVGTLLGSTDAAGASCRCGRRAPRKPCFRFAAPVAGVAGRSPAAGGELAAGAVFPAWTCFCRRACAVGR